VWEGGKNQGGSELQIKGRLVLPGEAEENEWVLGKVEKGRGLKQGGIGARQFWMGACREHLGFREDTWEGGKAVQG